MSTTTLPEILERPAVGSSRGGWKVVVYDNDTNTYDEVIAILIEATGCDLDEAYLEAWEIDHLGRSDVHFSRQEVCEAAATVIGRIGIRVEVCPDD